MESDEYKNSVRKKNYLPLEKKNELRIKGLANPGTSVRSLGEQFDCKTQVA